MQRDHAGRHPVHSSDVDGQVDLHGHETVSSLIHAASIAEKESVITDQLKPMLDASQCSVGATVAILLLVLYCINIQYFSESTMLTSASKINPEELHPSLWRASQLARSHSRCISTGHPSLDNQLPGGGWPTGSMTDLHVQQAGVGELRLLAPALATVARRQIAFLQPPHPPQALALAAMGLTPESALWLRASKTADCLWAAEQVLRSGSCGALLFWQNRIRPESQRRLTLAAQEGETLFFIMRPLAAAQDPSPAPLRLALRPRAGGLEVGFVKRRGPQRDEPLFLPMMVGTAQRMQPQPSTTPVYAGVMSSIASTPEAAH